MVLDLLQRCMGKNNLFVCIKTSVGKSLLIEILFY